ncbi:MAG: hypothetical protein KC483_10185 [Nitrosarchaeum sp.]|nr:hypothetical protein [Nitrosarchaeum sp.]
MSTQLFLNPHFVENRAEWEMYRDVYEGDYKTLRSEIYLPKFVVESTVEGKKAYQQRLARTFYTNLIEGIVDIWVNWVFKETIDHSDVKGSIFTDAELENIDGDQTSLEDFAKDFFRTMVVYGRAFIHVNQSDRPAVSKLDDLIKRPYASIINPLEIPDWIYVDEQNNLQGGLKAIDYHYLIVKQRESTEEEPRVVALRRRFFVSESKVTTILYQAHESSNKKDFAYSNLLSLEKSNWDQIGSEVELEIDELPFVYGGDESWIKSISGEALRRHQLVSSVENILHFQGYKHTMIAGDLNPNVSGIQAENTIMWLKAGSTVTELSDTNPLGLLTRIDSTTDLIFKMGLNQVRQIPGTSKVAQSEGAAREEKEPQVAAAKAAISEIETVLNGMVRLWAKFKGTNQEGKIKISRNFTTQDVKELALSFSIYRDYIGKVEPWLKAHLAKVVDQEGYDPEDLSNIKAGIEAITVENDTGNVIEQRRNSLLKGFANAGGVGGISGR